MPRREAGADRYLSPFRANNVNALPSSAAPAPRAPAAAPWACRPCAATTAAARSEPAVTFAGAAAPRDAVGIYGKIPAQGDFARINASDPAAQASTSLGAGVAGGPRLRRRRAPLRSPCISSTRAAPHGPALVGAMLRLRDRVGRVPLPSSP